MRPSKYVVVSEDYIFSTIYLSVIKVNKEIKEAFLTGEVDNMPEQIRRVLHQKGFLVEEDFDERAFVEYRHRLQRYSQRSISITYIPGYRCNLACAYCYASSLVHETPLNTEPIDNVEALIKWLDVYMSTVSPRKIEFSFHGGEPLMYAKQIIKVAEQVSKLADSYKAEIEYHIVTNGTVLNSVLVKQLMEPGITKYLITIDGPQEIHDERRISRSGKSTFDSILNNAISILKNNGTVIMGPNVDTGNKDEILRLIDILVERGFGNYPKFRFVVAAVMKGPDYEQLSHFKEHPPLDLKDFAKVKIDSYRYATQKGLRISYPFGIGLCTLKMPNAYIIDSKSQIYKCTTLTGYKESWVGTLEEDLETISRRISQLDMAEPWLKARECQECKYLPTCVGGCPQQAMLNSPETTFPHGIWCPKEFLDSYTPGILKVLHARNERFPELVMAE